MNTYDVAVVGAGPAGSVAALHAARAGCSVIVLEKSVWPRTKVCGGGVLLRARRHLPLDVEFPIERSCRRVEMNFLASARSTTTTTTTNKQTTTQAPTSRAMSGRTLEFAVVRDDVVVAMTMRADLDAALLRAATASGAEFRSSCAVEALTTRGDHVELATSHDTVRARFVVLADGATGPCAKLAGWTAPLATIPALEAEVRVSPADLEHFGGAARFDFGGVVEGGYGWVFGKREHLSCGVLSMRRGSVGLRERLDEYLKTLGRGTETPLDVEPLDAKPLEVEAMDVRGYVIPIRPRVGGFARGRVLLAGDTAGLADPVTAEGISLAMHSGRLAAEAIVSTAANDTAANHTERDVATRYDRAIRREIGGELRVARALAGLLYRRPRLARALFERAGPSLCEAMADVCLGTRTYRGLVADPRNWARLVMRRDRPLASSTANG